MLPRRVTDLMEMRGGTHATSDLYLRPILGGCSLTWPCQGRRAVATDRRRRRKCRAAWGWPADRRGRAGIGDARTGMASAPNNFRVVTSERSSGSQWSILTRIPVRSSRMGSCKILWNFVKFCKEARESMNYGFFRPLSSNSRIELNHALRNQTVWMGL